MAAKELDLTQWFRIQSLPLSHFSDPQVTPFHALTSSSVKMEIKIEGRKDYLTMLLFLSVRFAFYCVLAQFFAQWDPGHYCSA